MISDYSFLLLPFLACVILTGIHTYLGMHVIARGVIFVDISLAQIAALGMTVALWLGWEPESMGTYFFALGATLIGALFFAFFRHKRIPTEAVIGVCFAIAQALSFLIADRLAHGSEHIKYLLNGNILWVDAGQILKMALIYSALGVFFYFAHNSLWLVSHSETEAAGKGLRISLWNLIFYISFGIVITSSVQVGGILLVFIFLIVPALCSLIFFKSFAARLIFGWSSGVVVSLASIIASYYWDMPTGPAIVAGFGAAFALCLIFKRLFCRSGSD